MQNTSIHHEMMGPLKANVLLSERLMRVLENPEDKKMLKIIFVSSQLLLHHASDLLDQRVIDNGNFMASYSLGNVSQTILEMVELVRMTLEEKNIRIIYNS